MRHTPALLIALASLTLAAPALAQGSAPPAQPAKKTVKTADDLPRHTYKVEGKASQFFVSDAPFKAFAAKVKADLLADLEAYDITDRTTLQGYYRALQQAALLEGNWDEALGYIDRIKGLEEKESKRLMAGQTLRAIAAANRGGGDEAAMKSAFRKALRENISALPWDVIRDDVTMAKAQAEMMNRELLMGALQSQLDPIVEAQNGQLSGDLARQLLSMRVMADTILPWQPEVAEVYGVLLAANTGEKKDIWSDRRVNLTDKDAGTPVVVCVWDSGVDVAPFTGNLFINAKERPNGKDDDGNGFVDDVHGIAFDLRAVRTPDLLFPIDELKSPLTLVENHTKGLSDLQANIDSPEASALKAYMKSLKAEQVKDFMEDLGLYGNYSHGTHVAGITAEGNPFARILPCRLSFDYRQIPLLTPSEELSRAAARMYKDSVDYMKAAGVRVVNMSWGGSPRDIEASLEAKGAGKDAADRAVIARALFAIERDGLREAIASAPDILFIAAAGNSDNNNEFAEMIPSGLTLPNLVTVGAVDQAGKPTGFTTFGPNVRLYANGFEVESYVPGGKRVRYSGTSMAAPNVANLAAKILAVKPALTPAQVIEIITKTADPMEGHSELLVINPKKGFGR